MDITEKVTGNFNFTVQGKQFFCNYSRTQGQKPDTILANSYKNSNSEIVVTLKVSDSTITFDVNNSSEEPGIIAEIISTVKENLIQVAGSIQIESSDSPSDTGTTETESTTTTNA